MIRSFDCAETEKIWNGIASRKLPSELQSITRRKLRMLNSAHHLEDLRIPPNNRLEKLKGDRDGYYSIRVNNQWRICFEWHGHDCERVKMIDYH